MRLVLPVAVIFFLVAGIVYIANFEPQAQPPLAQPVSTTSVAAVAQSEAATSTEPTATSSLPTPPPPATTTPKKPDSKPNNKPSSKKAVPPPPAAQVERVQTPYTTPPESFENIDVAARAALVNIICMPL